MKVSLSLVTLAMAIVAQAAPSYMIFDVGVAVPTDANSQGFRISGNGQATGRSLASTSARAFSWTSSGGTVGLPLSTSPARSYCVGNGINNAGVVAGTGATTSFGSSRIPLLWTGGVLSAITLPAGQTLGDATDINDSGLVVGSVNSGSLQRAAFYVGGVGNVLSANTPEGWGWTTGFAVNNAGIMVGSGRDGNNAAVTLGLMYDTNTDVTTNVGALTGIGHNSAICFDISENGVVVGSSSLNSGSGGRPFKWDAVNGMTEIPMPTGASSAIARGVNSAGWIVGIGSSAFALPFVYDGTNTYRLGDLLVNPAGWDLLTNTSSSAMSISESGWICGTGIRGTAVRAYVAIPATPISGVVELQDHANDVGKTVAWELKNGATVVDSGTTTLGTGGSYNIGTIKTGNLDLRMKARTWIGATLIGLNVDGTAISSANLSLKNGDVNGDNIVDIADYSYLAGAFDLDASAPNWLTADGNGIRPVDSDLNGDTNVDIADYTILAMNFDAVGD
ncbi:MAG: hypothetical protein JNJ45_07830 [Chthonomonas sp.]|nr:hypothetical protein [Chthonomonas sp.]